MSSTSEKVLTFASDEALMRLLGTRDEILRLIERRLQVQITARGSDVRLNGADPAILESLSALLVQFSEYIRKNGQLSMAEVRYGIELVENGMEIDLLKISEDVVCFSNRGKAIRPYTHRQKEYVDAIKRDDVVFAIGPAGTGKTYLAVSLAVAYLKTSRINRIVLVRPVVEAGEKLGYLPGDLLEKVEPYLRPLYDAFYELLPHEKFERYFDKNVIEIAPLAYMRGRTLNDSFIILDEAQNTSPEQMKMFLTRLGAGSKAVITGDVTQVDLPSGKESGLHQVREILSDIDGVSFVYLTNRDIVRHEIVQKIVRAYENYEHKRNGKGGADDAS